MFDADECLVCGRPAGSTTVYCSKKCEREDALSSPAVSSANSSAYNSPQIPYAYGGDIPDIAGALGPALSKHRYSVSSTSSASSAGSWTFSDYTGIESESDFGSDLQETQFAHPARMIYARRPSTTNHGAVVPRLPSRGASSYRSAPSIHSTEDDEDISYRRVDDKSTSTITKTKRRNRASLPAHFSLLSPTTTTSAFSLPRKPTSTASSAHTIAHASPPTPRVASTQPRVMPEVPLRGRQRTHESSRDSRRSERSQSRSRSARGIGVSSARTRIHPA